MTDQHADAPGPPPPTEPPTEPLQTTADTGEAPPQPSAGPPPAGRPPVDEPPSWSAPQEGPPPGGASPGAGTPLFPHLMVRPVQGRYVTGVCAGLARATGTDPLLWRVLLAVLGLFGVGILIYLVLWLVTPAEGDTGSPLDSLFGRGRSSTPPLIAAVLGVGCALALAFTVAQGAPALLLGVAIVVGCVMLARRQSGGTTPPLFRTGMPPQPGPAFFGPVAAKAPTGEPMTFGAPAATAWQPPPGPAFAPHGPYAPPPPKPAPVPRVKRPKSRLGLATFSLMLVTLGVLGCFSLAGVGGLHGGTYVAAALGVLGLGLLIGTWWGRAWKLIPLGLILTMVLAIVAGSHGWRHEVQKTTTWQPLTIAELQPSYRRDAGKAVLDLSKLDFTGQRRDVAVQLSVGSIEVILPPKVDAAISSRVDVGHARVLGRESEGPSDSPLLVSDLGPDGAGGGNLILNIKLDLGDLEVTR